MRIQLQSYNWMGQVSVLLAEIGFQELLYNGWLSQQKHSADRQFSTGIFLKHGLSERLFNNGHQALSLNLNPISHQDCFLGSTEGIPDMANSPPLQFPTPYLNIRHVEEQNLVVFQCQDKSSIKFTEVQAWLGHLIWLEINVTRS